MNNVIMDIVNAVLIWPLACIGLFALIDFFFDVWEKIKGLKGSHYLKMLEKKKIDSHPVAADMFCDPDCDCNKKGGKNENN